MDADATTPIPSIDPLSLSPWSALHKNAKIEAYELSSTKRATVTMALKTMLSFVHTATQTTCTLLIGLLGTMTDVDVYVRPLCRSCVEKQYWLLRLIHSQTFQGIVETLKTNVQNTVNVVKQGMEPLVTTVQEIYEEEVAEFARERVGDNESTAE